MELEFVHVSPPDAWTAVMFFLEYVVSPSTIFSHLQLYLFVFQHHHFCSSSSFLSALSPDSFTHSENEKSLPVLVSECALSMYDVNNSNGGHTVGIRIQAI